MKKLATLVACSAFISLHAQTILFSENFNGASPAFTLNTADVSSSTGGYNTWVINNVYTGGSFTDPCFGFNIPIGNTASQPAGITGFPNSKYMHILNTDADAQGVDNTNFLASDGNIICVGDQNYFTKMTTPMSTTGQTNVNLSFWWLCGGAAGAAYGEVYYSTDGGSTWSQQGGPLSGQTSWVQATYSNPLWDNQASLLFGFRFYNAYTGASPTDPAFAVDEISVFVPAAATITTGNITAGSPYCAGENIIVPYTISGTFTGGNSFTAQLSDALGSFATPVAIGSVVSTSAGNINCMIPVGTASGTAYQIRVVSSSPIAIGTTTGPLTIDALPNATSGNTGPYCEGATIILSAAGGGTTYAWSGPVGFSSSSQNPNIPSSTVAMSGAYTVTVTSANGCTNSSSTTVSVIDCSGIEDEVLANTSIYPNPSADVFTISIPDAMVNESQISIINLVGEMVHSFTPSQNKNMISTESLGLKSGVYLVQIKWHNESRVIRLIVR
jgi:hypothetical protein